MQVKLYLRPFEGRTVCRAYSVGRLVLRAWVGEQIGPIAKPDEMRFADNLPKTRSGKIMRRLLRTIAKGETITQDTSTLENEGILKQLQGEE